jgi:ABC-2 type transport system ATP-binding protein
MLRFDNIHKRYGDRVLFNGLNYSTGIGCVVLLDENGGGRSTLLGILAGAVEADKGEVWLAGHSLTQSPLEAKAVLAYIPDECMDYPMQTGREFLEHIASTRKATVESRTLDLASEFDLTRHLDKRFEQMSYGTRKKIYLTATSIGEPSVIIADEPSAGLDAGSRVVLTALFNHLAKDRTVFFASHDAELASACNAKSVGFADLI